MNTMMWTRGLDETEKKRLEGSLSGSLPIIERLYELMDIEEKALEQSEANTSTYETSNWAYKQAHINGERSALRKIKQYLTLDQQKDK